LLSKNTRSNITPEQEQAMLPIVIELFEGAMELGYVKFKQAARYVREFLAQAIDQDAADSIPMDTLQGAYIATSRRHKDKAITPKAEVITVESFDELTEQLDKPAEKADTGDKANGNATQQLDQPSTGTLGGAPSQDVRAPDAKRNTGEGTDGRSGSDLFGGAKPDGAGSDLAGGVGTDTGAVPVSGRGSKPDAKNAKKPRLPGNGGTQQGDGLFGAAGGLTPDTGANPAPNAPPIASPQPAAEDFTITDELQLGVGGKKSKFKNNIAAIKLVRELESTGRMATPSEQAVLAKYVGWGGLPQAFDANNADWAKEHAEITSLMSDEELASARQSTRYAHFTSREIIVDGIYAAMRQFGFTGGKTLESGAGVGNFLGLMPADMRSAGRFTAIEREPFSSAIARQLYPQQNVQRADFTEFKGNDGYFDASVGNPPFASDPQTDRSGRKHLSGLSLHNYFFAKNIDMLREGGIMAQVVTNSFLDAKGDKARKYISDRAELLGAIRLPNSAFSKNANTEVTTDIIFLKKRPDSEVGGKAARADAQRWLNIGAYTDKNGKQVALNQYFIDNPGMMLGEFGAFGTMYGPDQSALVAKPGQDTLAMLKDAVGRLPSGVYKSIAETGTDNHVNAAVVALKNPSVKEGGYFVEGDKLMQRLPDIAGEARGVEITPESQWTEKMKLGEPGFERIKSLSAMRTTVRGLLAAEMSDDAKSMTALRKTLNEQYDTYRDTHGLINDPATLRVFDDDPDFPLLASLEHSYMPGTGPAAAKRLGIKPTVSTAKKGPIFTQRVVASRQAVQKVESPADALAVSMAERGKLDAAYIGSLLNMEPEAVLKELSTGDTPLLFRDPATDEYVLRDAYLSGNVRAKLAQAKQAGMFLNINALEAVQPEDVSSHEITARLGSPWVPAEVYRDFAQSLHGEDSRATVVYLPLNSSYQVFVNGGSDVAMSNTWGTKEYPGDALLQAVMNNRTVKVTYRDSDGKTHTDVDATERANNKAQEIKEKFNDWIFSDAERSELLTKAYNETNNNYVTRVYDGGHMTFPGKVPDSIIKFRRHQRNAIARIVQDRTALLDHVVGAGKTFTVVAGAMELKRTGLANKSMVVVPNHLVKQWAADFYRLYPGANVLTATKKDFEKANRRKFLARIATGDWDAVVIAHSSYGFIRPAPEFEVEFNGREIRKIMTTIQSVEAEDGDKQVKKRTVKQLEGMKERLENRIKALRDKPMDDLLDFEQIGVDQLFVDEAHMFKNLMYTTKMQGVAGLNDPTGSQRSYDMYVKTNQVMEKNGRGQGVVFATGTPVSNSLAEMYHMMRYLMPTQMRELGFESFDAWANTYASVEQVWMQAPSGDGFKAQNRMSNFVNTPELLKMFDQVSDTVTMDDIKQAYKEENNGDEFPLPKLKGGRRTPVSLEKSEAQDAYMVTIAARAKAIEQRKGPPQKGDDNILVVMSDARKAAMDIRLVNEDIDVREPGGRIDRSTDEVVARYKQYDSVKGTQLVFSDMGTPLKHAKKELKEYEAMMERVQAGTEDVAVSATLGNEAAMGIMEDAEAAQAELSAMGQDWLSAVKSAMRGFSIYDDFKAALIEKGVPEEEIAFIHDANTDDQKAALFRKVNAGQIRVLLGSTAKMGAGTNVQDRLVAEHHLDVPWRPSDVEQREGRIERQGNLFATPPTKDKANLHHIPGFEIEILAYVTRDTLDMRMWQVQETKLKMINQLRTRKIGREIDNAFEDMELSAGEMQAAATGDINLLKEIQLRNNVKKMEQRRRSFDGQRNDLIARKRRNAEQLRDLPKKLEAAEVEAKFAEQYKSDLYAKAPPFKMNIDGKDYSDVKEAQAYLLAKHEATEEHTDLAGEVTTKKAPLSVTIDGELIKNRATMNELFANARGDVDLIMWDVNGETYRRRTVLANAIRQNVINALADENVQQVGTIGAYSVAVEGSIEKDGTSVFDVTMRRNGDVKLSNAMSIGETGAAPGRVITQAENLMQSTISEANYLDRALQRAKKDAIELDAAPVVGEWPDQPKLDAARTAHKDVLALLKKKDAAPVAAEVIASTANLAQTGAPEANDTDVVFSRSTSPAAQAQAVAVVESQIQGITSRWANAPRIVVAFDMQDSRIPERVRTEDLKQRSGGAAGTPEGFYYKGMVYLLASQLNTPKDTARVLFHETLGHYGLRGVFGEQLKPILQQLAALRKKEVRAKAVEYGLRGVDNIDMLTAAEEVLAEMAQSTPDLGFVKRAIAIIRSWLRRNVPGFKNMALTDAEIINDYILPARGWVERGQAAAARGALAFARKSAILNSNDFAIAALVKKARQPGNDSTVLEVAGVAPAQAATLQRAGIDIDTTSVHTIDVSGLRHAMNRHADPKTEISRNQLPLTDADFMRISEVVSAPDAYVVGPKSKRGLDLVAYIKRFDDGSTLYIEEVRTGKNRLAMLAMRKYPGTKDFNSIAQTLLSNAQSDAGEVRIVLPSTVSGQVDTPAFKKWFGDSKAVDADGKPLVVYHGTRSDIQAIDVGKSERLAGFWMTTDPKLANIYAAEGLVNPSSYRAGANVMPLYVRIEKPYMYDERKKPMYMAWQEYQEGDYDGFIETGADTKGFTTLNVKSGDQVKSAIGNNGDFDAANPDIRFSRKQLDDPTLGWNTSPDALRKMLGSPGYSQRTLAPIMRDVDAAGAIRDQLDAINARFDTTGSVTDQGLITIAKSDAAYLTEIKAFAQEHGLTVVARQNFAGSQQELRAAGFTTYTTPTENNPMQMGSTISSNAVARFWSPAGTGVTDTTPMFSRSSLSVMTNRAMESINEALSHPGKMSFWDKTVGSMYNLAERNPPFKRVFTAAQNFINDVSFYGTEAADLAPKMLPKLDGFGDMLKSPVSSVDNKAISVPINEGTLIWARDEAGKPVLVDDLQARYDKLAVQDKAQMLLRKRLVTEGQLKRWQASALDIYDGAVNNRFNEAFLTPGVVWTDAELRSLFSLTDGQIALYREFRAATDKSLDNLAKADLLRFGGKDVESVKDLVMQAQDADVAAVLLRDYLMTLAGADLDRADVLNETANGMIERGDKVRKLKERGYAPLSRFGRYTVDVVVRGQREYFSLFETARAANQMAAKMRMEFGAANVAQGTLSQREFEAFQGITPESLELFGNMLGLDSTGDEAQDKVFQAYLKLTKSNRSAMKRMIHRKGIAGYSNDMGRVLAAFVYSNARQTSAALHMGEMGEAVQDIPKDQGELKDVAIELSGYIKQPREEAQALRSLMFAQYLGGSVASALVNFTQPLTVSLPYLSQYGGAGKAASALIKALRDQNKGAVLEKGLADALKIAEEQGIVAPQEVHQLMAQARGTSTLQSGDGTRTGEAMAFAGNAFTKLALGWGRLFGLFEQVNRRTTFIAAYRMAQERNMANPIAFATKAVNDTQFINNKANKAKWARGPIGATLMTFKSYSINYLELFYRLSTQSGPEGKKAAALMLGMLLLVAGTGGLPFADDLDDAIDFMAQRMGYNFSAKQAKRQFLEDLFGKATAQFVDKGITGIAGSPIDISGRMSMANLLPGTGLLLKKTDHSRDLQELLGPVGDLVKRGFSAANMALSGDFGKAALEASPRAVANAAKGVDMANTGIYTDTRGRKVIETDLADAASKFIGFQPQAVARVQDANWRMQNMISQTKLRESEIADRWAQGVFEGDKAKVADAREMLADWNEKNPDTRIKINMPQIIKRVRAMRMSKADRIAASAPRELRAAVRKELASTD
jgi:N12 class adenine-specific DNA methylase